MALLATRFRHFVTWLLLLNPSFHVEAYYIGPACADYKTLGDLGPVIQSSMKESRSMAKSSLESGLLSDQKDQEDNSKDLLYQRAEKKHFQQVIGTYSKGNRETFAASHAH
jgi:hypothetical protein